MAAKSRIYGVKVNSYDLPVGTNIALLQFMWMLVSGRLLSSRGALFPALKAIGLADDAMRRAWAAFRGGVWCIDYLLRVWQRHVDGLPGWRYHKYEGYKPLGVDITAFFRPSLKGCPSKHYHPLAKRAIPAVIMGIVGQVGTLHGQRLAIPREFLRVEPENGSEAGLRVRLVKRVARKLKEDEAALFDAGFKLSELQAAKLQRYVLRVPKNFTARRQGTIALDGARLRGLCAATGRLRQKQTGDNCMSIRHGYVSYSNGDF
jgi:hypothetical protein